MIQCGYRKMAKAILGYVCKAFTSGLKNRAAAIFSDEECGKEQASSHYWNDFCRGSSPGAPGLLSSLHPRLRWFMGVQRKVLNLATSLALSGMCLNVWALITSSALWLCVSRISLKYLSLAHQEWHSRTFYTISSDKEQQMNSRPCSCPYATQK